MQSDDELSSLVRRAKVGEEDALSELIRRYHRFVFQHAYAVVRSTGDAEEVAQDTFIRMYQKLHTLKESHAISAWLATTTTRIAIDYTRKKRRNATESLEKLSYRTGIAHDLSAGALVEEALAALTPEHRAILLLREQDGYEYAEIAKLLRIPIGTVKSRLSYAKQAIRSTFHGKDHDKHE